SVRRLVPARPQSRAADHGARRSQAACGQGPPRHEDDLRVGVRGARRSRRPGSLRRRRSDAVHSEIAVGRPRQDPAAARPVRQASLVTTDAPAWALALRRGAWGGGLAAADAAGRRLVVPVCYALDAGGQRLYSAIDAKPKRTRQLRRLRNIRENPQVSLVVDHYDEDWTRLCYVIVEGRAEIVEAGPVRERAIHPLLSQDPQHLALGPAA